MLPSSFVYKTTAFPDGSQDKYLRLVLPTFIIFTGISYNSDIGSKSAIDVSALVCTCSVSLFTIPSKSSCSQENIANNPTNNKIIFFISITLLG